MFLKLVMGAVCLFSLSAESATLRNADEQSSVASVVEGSDRMAKRAGAYLGVLGDPFPTLVGVNIGYNAFDFLRLHAGIGKISASSAVGTTSFNATATTLGLGVRALVPGWGLSPCVGLGAAMVVYSSDGASISVKGFDSSGAHLYGSFGLDWQTQSGFNLGVGYNLSFRSGIGGLPYLNLGWFTNLI